MRKILNLYRIATYKEYSSVIVEDGEDEFNAIHHAEILDSEYLGEEDWIIDSVEEEEISLSPSKITKKEKPVYELPRR